MSSESPKVEGKRDRRRKEWFQQTKEQINQESMGQTHQQHHNSDEVDSKDNQSVLVLPQSLSAGDKTVNFHQQSTVFDDPLEATTLDPDAEALHIRNFHSFFADEQVKFRPGNIPTPKKSKKGGSSGTEDEESDFTRIFTDMERIRKTPRFHEHRFH